ncbi:fatty acyl-AMP ligase [Kitasatospora sp. NPDC056184]|uniref:fatty acyl-AMP ligase n=1 Tax=Kitasatospora sp. NPDC056184 TaxID=3345738 RepID=UPI0035DDB538
MVDLISATSVSAVFTERARKTGAEQAVAIVSDPADPASAEWLTFAELDHAARVFAQELGRTCESGARVLLLYPTSKEFVAAVLGCLYAGMVAVPSSMPGRYRHDQRRVLGIARDAEAACVLTSAGDHAEVAGWAAQEGFEVPVLCPEIDPTRDVTDVRELPADRDTLALLQYTSGSTSDPKGSMVTHGNLLANAATTAEAFRFEEGQRFGGWLPNYHDMGLMGLLLSPLLGGTSTVLMSPAAFLRRPSAWLQMFGNFGVTLSAAPNFAYELCTARVRDEELAGLDLSGWRYAVNGSEPVKSRVLADFAERFAPAGFRPDTFAPCFGMAEATLLVSTTPSREPVVLSCDAAALEQDVVRPAADGPVRTLVSCGAPRDLDVRIVDPATQDELAAGQVGEIWLSGPSVVRGYWRNEAATRETFGRTVGTVGGFLRTGDLGTLVDGELYVTGRIKEMMIIRGRNIYPHDIEHELRRQHEQLRDTVGAVVTVPGEGEGEDRLVLIHEIRRLAPEPDLADLVGKVRTTVSKEFGLRAHAVLLMRRGGVQRTTSGKVRRAEMRAQYLDGELRPVFADGYRARAEAAAEESR